MYPVSRTLLGLGVRYNCGLLAPLPYGVHFLIFCAFTSPGVRRSVSRFPSGRGGNGARYVGFRELRVVGDVGMIRA